MFGVLMLTGLWIAFTQRVESEWLVVGLVAAVGIVSVQKKLFPTPTSSPRTLLRRLPYGVMFLVTLFVRFVVSTLRTSFLVLRGNEEGEIVALPTRITTSFGRFILLHSITLTPSTISLLSEGDLLYIHWLRPKGKTSDWRSIKEPLEKRLLPVFEGRRDGHMHR